MIKSIKKTIGLLAIISILTLSACDREPIPPPQPRIEQISIADLKAMHQGSTVVIDSAVFIQGIVTLTPEKNNIPDFVGYMQDETGGITLTVDGNNNLSEGSEIKIFCEGIELSDYNGLLQFGNIDLGTQSELISISADPITPVSVTIQDILDGEHIAELVSISGVEFSDKGSFSGSQTLTNCSEEIAVYTRSDATFSGDIMPEGNGTFVGVASVYNDAQLLMRDPADLDMTGTRCEPFFEGIFQENFSSLSYLDPVTVIDGWISSLQEGDREWAGNNYLENKYVQATAHGSGLASMIAWMITPSIDLSNSINPVFSFDSKLGYPNGATLDVFISSDYDGSANPWNYTWTALNPTLPTEVIPGSNYSDWLSSGNIDLSAYSSTIYIAFVYTGSDGASKQTTTWQIDNVIIDESSK